MDSANKIKADFNKFDSLFKTYYQTAITPWMRIKDEMDKERAKAQPEQPPSGPAPGKTELGTGLPPAPPSGPSGGLPVPPMGGGFVNPYAGKPPVPPGASPPFTPPPAVPEEQQPDTERTPVTQVRVAPQEEPKIRVAHDKFYKTLEAMSGEDPRILCGYIMKYAKSIQGDDPETAISLFCIVKKLKE
jgi:hypothetical protein